MEIYQNKPRIKLSPTVRHGRKFIEVSFDHDGLRLPLSKEEGAQLVGGKACGRRVQGVSSVLIRKIRRKRTYMFLSFVEKQCAPAEG